MFTVRTLREGMGPIGVLAVLSLGGGWISPWAALLPLVLLLFTVAFFRDPARSVPDDPKAILAPADGRVVGIERAPEEDFLRAEATRVAIFLSIFDVHVQRSPIAGVVRLVRYQRGRHLDARDSRASGLNECRTVGIEAVDGFRVTVRQLAGKVARRIVGWSEQEMPLALGQRLGMIRFGSRVELFLPEDVHVTVRLGQHVKAGETILGRRR